MSNLNVPIGSKLARAIRDTSRNLGICSQTAVQRYVCEQILSGFQQTIKAPFAVGGGLIHHQVKRETGDADIRFVRGLDKAEIQRALHDMKDFLAGRGVQINSITEPQSLQMHAGNQGLRFKLATEMEGTRAGIHLDIGFGMSRDSFPEATEMDRDLPEFFKMQKDLGFGFKGWIFPKETQVAEKLVSALQRGAENTRLKDFWDIGFMSGQALDRDLLIKEMTRVIFERQIEFVIDDLLVALPEAMSLDFIDANGEAWTRFLEKHRRVQWTLFDKVMDQVRSIYGSIRQEVRAKVEARLVAEVSPTFFRSGVDIDPAAVSKADRLVRKSKRNLPAGVVDIEDYIEHRRVLG